jgi:hypothetical protein
MLISYNNGGVVTPCLMIPVKGGTKSSAGCTSAHPEIEISDDLSTTKGQCKNAAD